MRKTLIALTVAGVMAGCSSSQEAVPEDPALESTDEKVSYGMGLVMGQRMSNDLPNLKMEQFLQGIQHGHEAKDRGADHPCQNHFGPDWFYREVMADLVAPRGPQPEQRPGQRQQAHDPRS